MNETEELQFAYRIRQIFNQGISVAPEMAARLAAARREALARQRPEPAPVLAWADNLVGNLGGWSGVSLRLLVPTVALVASVAAIYTWQQNQRAAEVEEIDAQLLTDELPIDAYLDRGFQNWLKKRLAQEE
jgi:hypothetical protein